MLNRLVTRSDSRTTFHRSIIRNNFVGIMLLLSLSFYATLIFTIIVPSFEYNVTIRPRIVKPDGYQFSPDNDFIHVQMANWTLRVQRNVNLILSAEIDDTMKPFGSCEFYHGRLLRDQDALSSLTICGDKFYASMNVARRVFFVEPLNASHHHLYESTDRGKNTKRSQRYLRSTFYDLTGDVLEIGNENSNRTKKDRGHFSRKNERRRTSYLLKSKWKKNGGLGRYQMGGNISKINILIVDFSYRKHILFI